MRSTVSSAAKTIISIPVDKRILIVEDNRDRLDWFRDTFRGMKYVIYDSTDEALKFLENSWTPDVVFLDHDAVPHFVDRSDPNYNDRTFFRVAQQLAKNNFGGLVIVHSGNPVGAKRMADLLTDQSEANVVIAPFGTFKIVRTCVRD